MVCQCVVDAVSVKGFCRKIIDGVLDRATTMCFIPILYYCTMCFIPILILRCVLFLFYTTEPVDPGSSVGAS